MNRSFACAALELIRHRRRARRRRQIEREGLRATLLKPVHRAQAFQSDLNQVLHERARRKCRQQRPPLETPP